MREEVAVTHYTTFALFCAWGYGGREPRLEAIYEAAKWCDDSENWLACVGVRSSLPSVHAMSAHIDGVRASCPKCEVLWDEAVGA
jgi:hypothetical protein